MFGGMQLKITLNIVNGSGCLQQYDDESVIGTIKTEYHRLLDNLNVPNLQFHNQLQWYLNASKKSTLSMRLEYTPYIHSR